MAKACEADTRGGLPCPTGRSGTEAGAIDPQFALVTTFLAGVAGVCLSKRALLCVVQAQFKSGLAKCPFAAIETYSRLVMRLRSITSPRSLQRCAWVMLNISTFWDASKQTPFLGISPFGRRVIRALKLARCPWLQSKREGLKPRLVCQIVE